MSKLVLNRILTVFVFSLFMIQLAKPQHLLSVLASSDSLTNATVKIHQSEHITDLVFKNETQEQPQEVATSTAPAIKVSGFRVQVFSSNIPKDAKTEAFAMQDAVLEALPNVPVYIVYSAPFWKVRVGNCKTRIEAQALMQQISNALPQVKQDLYIVRDSILLTNQ
jgi:hypothetical protein